MVQHLLDPRSFSDHLASLSELGPARDQTKDLRDVEFLLVFAIGELLQGTLGRNSVLPGSRYFQEAVSQLPGFLTLRAAGTVGVEIMGLAAFYLQCADCKEDAYVYVGIRGPVVHENEANRFGRRGWACVLRCRMGWRMMRVVPA
jgi:proline utilization trans-activator